MHTLPVQVYYEDTDHSGVVYHANYLKYFERSREHLLGVADLVDLWERGGVGFVVYKATLTYKEGARFGDTLEIRTTVALASPFRAVFTQRAFRGEALLVDGEIELACVNREQQLVKLPDLVRRRLG